MFATEKARRELFEMMEAHLIIVEDIKTRTNLFFKKFDALTKEYQTTKESLSSLQSAKKNSKSLSVLAALNTEIEKDEKEQDRLKQKLEQMYAKFFAFDEFMKATETLVAIHKQLIDLEGDVATEPNNDPGSPLPGPSAAVGKRRASVAATTAMRKKQRPTIGLVAAADDDNDDDDVSMKGGKRPTAAATKTENAI